MNKHLKRLVIFVVSAALLVGGVYGGLTVYRNSNAKPVNVYQVMNFAGEYGWMDQKETNGSVRMENMQKIYLSGTQTVTEVFVTEGQQVKAGDPLLSFDTTLEQLDVEKAEIALEKLKMERDSQISLQERLNNASITEDLEAYVKSLERQLEQAYAGMPEPSYPAIPLGEWTEESPRYIERARTVDPAALLDESGLDHIFVVLTDVSGGQYTGYHGLEIIRATPGEFEAMEREEESVPGEDASVPEESTSGDASTEDAEPAPEESAVPEESSAEESSFEEEQEEKVIRVSLFDAAPLEAQMPEEPEIIATLNQKIQWAYAAMSESYTREELAQLKIDTAKNIRDMELQIRIDEVNLARLQAEISDGVVKAGLDGVIERVLPIEEMNAFSMEAVLVLSGGGGYYVTGTVSEFDRENLQIGQPVTLSSWTGAFAEGSIVEIGDRPVEQGGWSMGNNNVSWYPFKVFADASYELQEGDWINISYGTYEEDTTDRWYLQSFFIRSENGRQYVYKRGESGLLVKQYITTGKVMGEQVEIRSGLTREDWIAFPYGADVREGAKTQEAQPDQLYNDGKAI